MTHIITSKHGTHICVNEDEKFWRSYYLVSLDDHTGWESSICVNADNEQDALDYAVDYAESMQWEGYFLDKEDEKYYAEFDEVTYAGNHGRPLNSSEINIKQIIAL